MISPDFLLSLQANEPELVQRLAFDVAGLKRWTDHVEEFDDVRVDKRVLSERPSRVLSLEVECAVPRQIGLRADRLLASELQVSRSCLQRLERTAQIRTVPPGWNLRRSLRDGLRLVIDASSLPAGSVDLAAGASCPSAPTLLRKRGTLPAKKRVLRARRAAASPD